MTEGGGIFDTFTAWVAVATVPGWLLAIWIKRRWLERKAARKALGPDDLTPKHRERLERDFGIEMASLLERRESPFAKYIDAPGRRNDWFKAGSNDDR